MEKFDLLKTAKGYEVRDESGQVIVKRQTNRTYYACTMGKNKGEWYGLNWFGRPDLLQKGLSSDQYAKPDAIATIKQ